MSCFTERVVTLLFGCIVLAAVGGCAADPELTPCSRDSDCMSATRMCIAGHCISVDGNAASEDSGQGIPDAGPDAGTDTGTPATPDVGLDAVVDAGCGASACCRTDVARSCGPGTVCRPAAVGGFAGACVPCDATSGISCAHLPGGTELMTVASDCDGYAAGAETVTPGACRCDATARCAAGQNCNRGIRHQRDCMNLSSVTQGICVPQSGLCDPPPFPMIACDGTTFTDDCERETASGMGALARYGETGCTSAGGTNECFDDPDCGPGESCYGQHGCTPGMCRTDPSGGHCYDATDCAPWQDCSSGACVP